MTASLSLTQSSAYQRDGFLFPLDVMPANDADVIRHEFESIEHKFAGKGNLQKYLRLNAHYIFPFAYRIASNERILDAVESILGPNILAWGCELFIKEPTTSTFVSWHQDLTYWGLGSTNHEVTAWLALGEVTIENGCMRFLPGSQKQDLLPHIETFDDDNSLSRGQALQADVDESKAVNVCLSPGQMSLHHGLLFHSSSPNNSQTRRVGITVRYITPDVVPEDLGYDFATLVRGQNGNNAFRLVSPPNENLGEQELCRYQEIADHQNGLYSKPGDSQPASWDRLDTSMPSDTI